jgi:L-threonylcarbamoyladenylate synthase
MSNAQYYPLRLNLRMDFTPDVENCLDTLRNGGLILYPTDTIWGIGCDATNAAAVKKIYALKQRPETKSMIVLLADQKELLRYVTQPDLQVLDYLRTAQKPTTVIYKDPVGLADNLVNADGTIGIRIVKDDFCRHLVKRFRKPIVSTSANFSSEPAPGSFADIAEGIKAGVDYIVAYRQDDTGPKQPSAVIKWENGSITVLRS